MKNDRALISKYKQVFNEEKDGVKEVLADMCSAHSVFNGGFSPDPYVNAFNSGERNVVLRILTILNLDHNGIINLAKEE